MTPPPPSDGPQPTPSPSPVRAALAAVVGLTITLALGAAAWGLLAPHPSRASTRSHPGDTPAAEAAALPTSPVFAQPFDPSDPSAPRTGRGRMGRAGTAGGPGGNFGSRMGQRDPRAGVPEWTNAPAFEQDVFTLVRLRYPSSGRGGWRIDYPGADLNLSYRLENLTSMRVSSEPIALDIDDPELFRHPFSFMVDPRSLDLSRDEAAILRRYLLGGGFLLVDDFWGRGMWDHLAGEFAKVFPDRKWVSLEFDHPIFNVPYKLPYKPQVPSEDSAHATKDEPGLRRTWEYEITWEEPQPPDYRAFLDDKGRIMMLVCLNTDLSDGWEEEGISPWFFENYSEKLAYPMGINIIFHVLTH